MALTATILLIGLSIIALAIGVAAVVSSLGFMRMHNDFSDVSSWAVVCAGLMGVLVGVGVFVLVLQGVIFLPPA